MDQGELDMPISDEDVFFIVKEQFELIKNLREENSALLELLFKQKGMTDVIEKQVLPTEITSIGREPWYRKQARLEREFAKPRLSEISGIKETEDASQVG